MRGLFVTGTDTSVGKTVACAALLARFKAIAPLRYWKPIQTGIEQDNDTTTVMRLGECAPRDVLDEGVRLPRPLSPHLAARLSGVTIALDELMAIASAQPDSARWIVEGAGGCLVPLNERDLMADLIARLALPVLVVARTTLGTINHTLLTIEALRARSLRVAGVIMVGDHDSENRAAIELYGQVPVIGHIAVLAPLTPESLQRAAAGIDPADTLGEHFR